VARARGREDGLSVRAEVGGLSLDKLLERALRRHEREMWRLWYTQEHQALYRPRQRARAVRSERAAWKRVVDLWRKKGLGGLLHREPNPARSASGVSSSLLARRAKAPGRCR